MKKYLVPFVFALSFGFCALPALLPSSAQVSSPYARRFLPRTSDPATGVEGQAYWKSDTDVLRVHNGSAWASVGNFTGGTITTPLQLPDGTENAPALDFGTNGIYKAPIGIGITGGDVLRAVFMSSGLQVRSDFHFIFTDGAAYGGSESAGLARLGAAAVKTTNGSSGLGTHVATKFCFNEAMTLCDFAGAGTPEGSVTAIVGSTYRNTTNGDFYRKTSGTGNTGWTTP